MSYNGSGTFNINTAGQPVVTGTVISSTAFNALTADLGTGLSTAITKDGQTVATARIPFAQGINSSLVTDATSTTTGSIITAGGVGIAKALYVGTTANIAGTTTLAGVTATSITDSGLTSGRVTYAGTSGLLQDSANLTFNGTTLTANTIGAFTLGGTVAGGGNQLNNVIIGASSPLAGAFTTLSATGAVNVGGSSRTTDKFTVKNTTTNEWAASVVSSGASAGQSFGLLVIAGTNSSDNGLKVNSQAGSTLFEVKGDGATSVTGTLTTTSYVTVNSANASFAWNWSGVEMIATNGNNNTGTAANAAVTIFRVRADNITGRSISAGGTINASGADYAEYMTKASDFTIAKGDVIGIDANGKLTNVFSDAVSFVVKSTNPSYVGGDAWGNEDEIGKNPTKPVQIAATDDVEAETDEAFAVRMTQYETDKTAFDAALEAARQKVDRIAFAGQVPVNVTGATAGQYIIPVNDNGAIKGEAVSNPAFEQYQISVGKVIAIDADGRAKIIVKVA